MSGWNQRSLIFCLVLLPENFRKHGPYYNPLFATDSYIYWRGMEFFPQYTTSQTSKSVRFPSKTARTSFELVQQLCARLFAHRLPTTANHLPLTASTKPLCIPFNLVYCRWNQVIIMSYVSTWPTLFIFRSVVGKRISRIIY